MDPYLEDPNFWHSFHVQLAVELARRLSPLIRPKYYADVEVRTVAEEIALVLPTIRPDTGVYELPTLQRTVPSLAPTATMIPQAPVRRMMFVADALQLRSVRIYRAGVGELVTAIEILSPYNKRAGEGLDDYRHKRDHLLHSAVHLVELDLLRGGTRPGREVNEPPLGGDYILLVNRYAGADGRVVDIWPMALNVTLPILPVPLLAPDPDVPLDVNAAVQAVYQAMDYDLRINYRQPVPPPELRSEMAEWVKGLLAEKVKQEG
jgi:hypothetical protein